MGIEKQGLVFVSHQSSHVEEIKKIVSYLEESGTSCWYAPRDIKKSATYYEVIQESIEHHISVMLVYITEDIQNSKFVSKEIDAAINYNVPIVPIKPRPCSIPKNIEFLIRDLQWVDLEEEGMEGIGRGVEDALGTRHTKKNVEIKFAPEPVIIKDLDVMLYKIKEEALKKEGEVFVPFHQFDTVVETLKTHYYSYIFNPNHVGKRTAALNALQSLGVSSIYEFSSDVLFNDMVKHPIRSNTGMIYQLQEYDDLNEQKLAYYLDRLKDANSFLVMYGETNRFIELGKPQSIKVDSPTSIRDVVDRHLNWEGIPEKGRKEIELWMQKEETFQGSTIFPRALTQLIPSFKSFVKGNITVEELSRSLQINVEKRVSDWFAGSYNAYDLAFYLCLGFLGEETYAAITKEADALSDILLEVHEGLGKELPAKTRDEYLSNFAASPGKITKVTDTGVEHLSVVGLDFQEDGNFLWKYYWEQFPVYQPALLAWLMSKVEDKGFNPVSINVIVNLLEIDFSKVRHALLQPLAKSFKGKDRLIAINILEAYMNKTQQHNRIMNLVKSWTGSKNLNLQKTGLSFLEGDLGRLYFQQSLKSVQGVMKYSPKLFGNAVSTIKSLTYGVYSDKKYEHLYFSFWTGWMATAEGEELNRVARIAYMVFLSHPTLFFKTVERQFNDFWFPFIDLIYQNPVETLLMDKWSKWAEKDQQEHQKLRMFINTILDHGSESTKERMWHQLEKKVRKFK